MVLLLSSFNGSLLSEAQILFQRGLCRRPDAFFPSILDAIQFSLCDVIERVKAKREAGFVMAFIRTATSSSNERVPCPK